MDGNDRERFMARLRRDHEASIREWDGMLDAALHAGLDEIRSKRRDVPSNEERLAYYRSHGLAECADYPGGDAAFAADVLAGDPDPRDRESRKEDGYVVARMDDGRFAFDKDFIAYGLSWPVACAFRRNASRRGIMIGGSGAPPREPKAFWERVRNGGL